MGLAGLYRFYISLLTGAAVYFLIFRTWWVWLLTSLSSRVLWYLIEHQIKNRHISRLLQKHATDFKQQMGPYGIRMINKAESDPAVRRSLAEVFTSDLKKLQATVEQLEMMDALFRSGMRPDGDAYLLHDLKLKYGKYRLSRNNPHP